MGMECYYEYIYERDSIYFSGKVLYSISGGGVSIGLSYLFNKSDSTLVKGKELSRLKKLMVFNNE